MLTTTRLLIVTTATLSLSACMIDSPDPYGSSSVVPSSSDQKTYLYPEGYETPTNYRLPNIPTESATNTSVVVPETYHVSSMRSPDTAKSRDQEWVTTQNPAAYTIELAESNKASQVANVLYTAPKKERSAEVKYASGNQVYYKGVYGSYVNYDAAVQQLQSLPENVKQQAKIVSWSSVQEHMSN